MNSGNQCNTVSNTHTHTHNLSVWLSSITHTYPTHPHIPHGTHNPSGSQDNLWESGLPLHCVTATDGTQVDRILGNTFLCWAILPAHTYIKIVGRKREQMRKLVWPEMNPYEFQTPSQRIKTLVFWRPAKLPLEEINLATELLSSPDNWVTQEDRRQHVCAHCECQGQQVPNQRTAAAQQWWDQCQIRG